MHRPHTARWHAVFKVDRDHEIWILDLRSALPYKFYPVLCDLVNDKPIPRYAVPLTSEELMSDLRTLDGWGHRFFWSEKSQVFVVQLLLTFEPSSRPSEIEQVFISGSDFKTRKILKEEDVVLLPNSEFKEVYPEMHPDRSM
jgi:hypothetical protein